MFGESRLDYWAKNYKTYCQGGSLACPFEKYINMFVKKNVLEIGPGEGRQFYTLYPFCKYYSVADISDVVLAQAKFDVCKNKILISDYSKKFDRKVDKKFDVIHFWYVLHHVLPSELKSFFRWISKHLVKGGITLFNTAILEYDECVYGDDGILTSKISIEDIRGEALNYFDIFIEDDSLHEDSNGLVVAAIKKGKGA